MPRLHPQWQTPLTVFARWRQRTRPYYTRFLGPPHSPSKMAARSVQTFLHDRRRILRYVTLRYAVLSESQRIVDSNDIESVRKYYQLFTHQSNTFLCEKYAAPPAFPKKFAPSRGEVDLHLIGYVVPRAYPIHHAKRHLDPVFVFFPKIHGSDRRTDGRNKHGTRGANRPPYGATRRKK